MKEVNYTVGEVCKVLEEFAPLAWQEDYDNCGLLIGEKTQKVLSALLCIDVTENVIEEALSLNCQMIISHHPLIFFSGLKHLCEQNYVERCVAKALKNNIAIYAAHTCWDNAPKGVNYKIAEKIGLQNVQTLVPNRNFAENVGSGVIGELAVEENELEFLNRLKKTFSIGCIKHSQLLNKKIKRVALCGGSGSEFIQNAIDQNADVFLTADVKYHTYFSTEGEILLADIGHFESEQFTKEIFFEQLQKKMPKFAVHFSQIKTNQINYL